MNSKWALFFGTFLFVSLEVKARTLDCTLYEDGWSKVIATQSANLDQKPSGKENYKRTWEQMSPLMTLKGFEGSLTFWVGAIWYNNHPSGLFHLNNMRDQFPKIDVGAFFYKRKADGGYEREPSLVTIRNTGAPGFNDYANAKSDPTHLLYGYSTSGDYRLKCEVLAGNKK